MRSSFGITLAIVAVAAVVMFAQADELKDLSSADVAPQVQENKKKEVNLGESGFLGSIGSNGGSGLDNALLTSGTFTMMSSNGLEEEEELGESGFLGTIGSNGGSGLDTALLTSGSFLMMS